MIDHIVREIERQGYYLGIEVVGPKDLELINHYFDLHFSEFNPALVGPAQNKKRVENIRGDLTFWFDPLSVPPEFQFQFEFLHKLKKELNQKLFLGIKDFESHLAIYPPGGFYQKHLDRFEKDSSRVLSFVFYIHQTWEKEDGGELVLYSKDGKELMIVEPRPGSFFCFLSEEFPHEVKLAHKERRSMTGWMHTKILT